MLEVRRNGAATPKEHYVWCARYIDALISRYRDTDNNGTLDQTVFYCQDANFNVTSLVDTAGNVVERYTYEPYGKVSYFDANWVSRGSSSYANEILFAGYRLDAESQLYHVRHRHLHPTLGRWLERDPLGYVDGMNLYGYCMGNAPSGIDPFGLQDVPGAQPGQGAKIRQPQVYGDCLTGQYYVSIAPLGLGMGRGGVNPKDPENAKYELNRLLVSVDTAASGTLMIVCTAASFEIPLFALGAVYFADRFSTGLDNIANDTSNPTRFQNTVHSTALDVTGSETAAHYTTLVIDSTVGALLGTGVGSFPVVSTSSRGVGQMFRQVSFRTHDLAQRALSYRVNNGIMGTRNVAVFEYVDEFGNSQYIARPSVPRGAHAEEVIHNELTKMGIKPSQVRRIYSERSPCDDNLFGHHCADLIRGNYSHADVTYAINYAKPFRGQSRVEFEKMLDWWKKHLKDFKD